MNRKALAFGMTAVLVTVLVCSCENPIYALMTRTTNAPFSDVPVVKSFERELSIIVSWKEDAGADEYILRRADDKNILSFETVVYRGTETQYTDEQLLKGNRYLYRLDKRRGTRTFEETVNSLGVCSDIKQDFYEENNTLETASLFEVKANANLYYYSFIDGRVLEDADWYKIKVPPRATAVIVIHEINIPPAQTETVFTCTINRFQTYNLSEGGTIKIENTGNEPGDFFFMIGANKTRFSQLYADGTIRAYTLKLETVIYQ